MNGDDLNDLRATIGIATIGRRLTRAEMAKLCGLEDPERNGANTIRKWQNGDGPSGPVAALLETFAQVADNTASPAFRDAMATTILKRLRA